MLYRRTGTTNRRQQVQRRRAGRVSAHAAAEESGASWYKPSNSAHSHVNMLRDSTSVRAMRAMHRATSGLRRRERPVNARRYATAPLQRDSTTGSIRASWSAASRRTEPAAKYSQRMWGDITVAKRSQQARQKRTGMAGASVFQEPFEGRRARQNLQTAPEVWQKSRRQRAASGSWRTEPAQCNGYGKPSLQCWAR